jgi:hypothetical protein
MLNKLLTTLFGLCLSFTASSAGLGFNPFQKPVSPTSPGGTNQKPPPVTAPPSNIQPNKPPAPVLAPTAKPEKQSKK